FLIALGLVALDQTILSTALPVIASYFNAVSDLSWIASAYFLPQAVFMLFFGRVLTLAPAKVVFLLTIFLFELGSLFCAVAPSVDFLIFGRAFAGLGASGLWVFGPLLGGELAGTRWCFYINLPVGSAAIAVVAIFLPNLATDSEKSGSFQKWLHLDWVGTLLSFAMVTFLLIPLQWGGVVKSWSSPAVIVLLTLSGLSIVAFLLWEIHQGDNAILPTKIFFQRNMFWICVTTVSTETIILPRGLPIPLPILYQSKGHSAIKSGIDILPYMMYVASFGRLRLFTNRGGLVLATGYAWPFVIFCPSIASVGFGLLYTVTPQTSIPHIIGFQILLGAGLGGAMQITLVIAQGKVAHDPKLISIATSLVTFSQLMGCSVGLA
ncbi:MFS general substrate transporter, partial [Coniophora puteana RWD-64-598 SS2]